MWPIYPEFIIADDQDALEAIGLVVINWNAIESSLRTLLATVSRLEVKRFHHLLAHVGNQTITDSIRSHVNDSAYSKKEKAILLEAVKWADALRLDRNDLVHNLIYATKQMVTLEKHTARGKYQLSTTEIPVSDVKLIAINMSECANFIDAVGSYIALGKNFDLIAKHWPSSNKTETEAMAAHASDTFRMPEKPSQLRTQRWLVNRYRKVPQPKGA